MTHAQHTVESVLKSGTSYSLAKVEAILRDHLEAVADMEQAHARAFRLSILNATPYAALCSQLLAGDRGPSAAFAELLSSTDLSELAASERTLRTLLALSTDWQASGKLDMAGALLGLLIRTGLSIGNDRLVAEATELLAQLLDEAPSASAVSLSREDTDILHKSWRRWGSSSQTRCPDTLARLARIVQEAEDSAVRGHLAELAVWERLLKAGASGLDPMQRRRTLGRMLELCARAEVCKTAFAVRGTGLLARWARAAVRVPQGEPLDLRRVLTCARAFETTMTRAGVETARCMMACELEATHRELIRRWPSQPAVWECALGIARLRRATIERVDATAYERLAGLLRTTARFAAGDLGKALQVECMEIVALWMNTGDDVAVAAARRLLQRSEPHGEPRELLARAGLHLALGHDDHGSMHLRSAHHLARGAFAATSRDDAWLRGRAALIAALAALRLTASDSGFQLGDDAHRLRDVALDLVERARKSARQSECILLGRILLTLSRLRLREALRRGGAPRRVLVGQATSDADHAERLFRLAKVTPRALEAQWLKARILAADSGAASDRVGAGLRQIRATLEELGDERPASAFVGDHTWNLPLGHCVCHDYVQFMNAALMPNSVGDSLQRPPNRGFQDLRNLDSGTWMRYLLHPLDTSASVKPSEVRVFDRAVAA